MSEPRPTPEGARADLARLLRDAFNDGGSPNRFADGVTWSEWMAQYLAARGYEGKSFEDGVRAVMTIRCIEHRGVPAMNHTEATGAECAVCAVQAARVAPEGGAPVGGPWMLAHPMITSEEGEVYEGAVWELVPIVGATVKPISCRFPSECEPEALAVRDALNRLAARAAPEERP